MASGGLRELIPTVARTAVAVGVDGIFMEVSRLRLSTEGEAEHISPATRCCSVVQPSEHQHCLYTCNRACIWAMD